MRVISRVLMVAFIALAYFGLPAKASAERVYYLVGVRHVYRIGTDKYFHATERKQIEQDYADEVSADNAHYQYQISHGADPNTESAQLQSALNDLAAEREKRLSGLYEVADYVRRDHPSFNIKVDGPYQVIGVDYHVREAAEVWDNYVVYAPWPGYVVEGPNPYGWSYGVVYAPGLFVSTYNGWYGGWIGFGRPAFVGFYGFGGPIVCAGLSINIGIGGGYGGFFYNPGLGGFYHRGPGYFAHDAFRGGYIASHGDPRAVVAGRAGYTAGASAIRSARAAGYAAGIRAGARSSFGGGTAPRTGSSFGRPAAAGSTSGYTHSAVGARSSGGSFGHTTGNGVSSNRGSSSGYAHSTTGGTPRSNGGSFGHSGASTGTSKYSHSSSSSSSHGSFGSRGSSGTSHSSTSRGGFGGSSSSSHGSFGGSRTSGSSSSSHGSGSSGRKRGG